MLTSLSLFFYRTASWKTLLAAIILWIPFPAYILKNLEIRLNTLAGKPIGPIDLLFGYNPEKIRQMVAAYGPEGRAVYALGELTADVAYPLIYTALFCLILSLLFRHLKNTRFYWINCLPISILFFDLLENACIVYLLKTYPDPARVAASLCAIFTNLKWGASAIVLLLILTGFTRRIVNRTKSGLITEQGQSSAN